MICQKDGYVQWKEIKCPVETHHDASLPQNLNCMKSAIFYLSLLIFVLQVGCTTTRKSSIKNEPIYPEMNPFGNSKDSNSAYNAAQQYILSDSNFSSAHVGISIYNPTTQQYLYNYQGDKYFVPASNMKLLTCYAAMKNLGDSLVGLRYDYPFKGSEEVIIGANGDPTFLHPDFKKQVVFEFLKNRKVNYLTDYPVIQFSTFGKGWAWDDYQSDYVAERSVFPIYGNMAKFYLQSDTLTVHPKFFFNYSLHWKNLGIRNGNGLKFKIVRPIENNDFHSLFQSSNQPNFSTQYVPFKITPFQLKAFSENLFMKLLADTLHETLGEYMSIHGYTKFTHVIHSQPTDSLLKPMMHNSDNFFAEQTLLMVSNEKLGVMNDERIIDTLLKTDFKGLPQKPRWVDGSGLSRYNLITPQDFVWVLTKMKADFSWQRITTILPTGNEGTLNNYYKNLAGNIFAKTGTLSGQVALSGYLITKQGKTFVFSVLVNNHQTSATAIRRGVEKFLTKVYEQY